MKRKGHDSLELWHKSLIPLLKMNLTFEELFCVDRVKVWCGQLTSDVMIDGLVRHTTQKSIPGITPLKVLAGARLVVREDSTLDKVEVEILGHGAESLLWLWVDEDAFYKIRNKIATKDLRAGRGNVLRGEGMQRYQMYSRARPPFV